jgi:hypothetical protein
MRMARFAALVGAVGVAVAASVVGFAGGTGAAYAAPSPHNGRGGQMYGDPGAAAPFWRRQHGTDCAEMAAADAIGEVTGRQPSEQEIDSTAQRTQSIAHPGAIWTPGGPTNNMDISLLLALYKVGSDARPSSIDAIEQALAQGHKVIAGVNGFTLWNERGDRSKQDHFVVVTGIDTGPGTVHLNDSGNNAGRDEQVPLATFERSWATGGNYAIVTR